MRRLGVHISIAGGLHLSLERAKALGCNAMQIFSHNPRGWGGKKINKDEAEQFKRFSDAFDIRPVFIHSSYLINLASPNNETRRKSIEMLSHELCMADLLGVDYVVLHPGKAVGQKIRAAVRKASDALSTVYKKTDCRAGILLENTAGQKGDISSSVSLISEIIENSPQDIIKGICLDTCHAYAAGYDITNTEGLDKLKEEIMKYLSPLKVELIHLNDSRKGLSSGVDRHQHIGKGHIGLSGFKELLFFPLFKNMPLILETPKESEGDDYRNLKRVRKILGEIE